MVVKRVSSVNLNVEGENTYFLSQVSRMDDSTLHSDMSKLKDNPLLLDIKKLKLHDFISIHGKSIKVCFEDRELEEIFLSMNEQIMYLKDKVDIIGKELVSRNKDFMGVTTRFAKLISKVYKLNKSFWFRLKFLFTGTKGWVDEFKELNT
jgi:hypothetical protein